MQPTSHQTDHVGVQETVVEGQTIGPKRQRPKQQQGTELVGSASEVNIFIEGIEVISLLDTGSTVSTVRGSYQPQYICTTTEAMEGVP